MDMHSSLSHSTHQTHTELDVISQVNQERQENIVSVDHSLRVLRIQQVAEKLSIGKSTIYDWLNPKSPRYDASFPKPIKLSAKSIGWLSSEVDAWLIKRVALTRITDLTEVEMESDIH